YRWDVTPGGNLLPADLLDLAVTASWTVGGTPKTFTLRSIIGERKFSPATAVNAGPTPSASPTGNPATGGPTVRGRATVDYTFHGETGFSSTSTGPGCPTAPCKSELIADIGLGESRIEVQNFATADQFTSYGNVRVVRTYPSGQTPPNPPPDDLVNVSGATSRLHGPPSANLVTDATTSDQSAFLNEVSTTTSQATLNRNHNSNVKVGVENALPYAEGTAGSSQTFQGSAEFSINNTQKDMNTMKWWSTAGPFAAFTGPWTYSNPTRIRSFTSATTGALGTAGRGVTTTAEAGLPYVQMFQVAIGNSAAWTLLLQDVRASVTCKSTANPATATATASHFAWLTFHVDPLNDGKAPRSMDSVLLTLNSAAPDQYGGVNVTDALATLRTNNPLIWDGTGLCCISTSDIHVFEERNAAGAVTKRGYFKSITVNKTPHTYVSPDGRTTQASIDGFLRLETTPLNPAIPETATSLSMGKVSCEAVDNR
ncbi:MAG TPA: hypothetical protein VHI71_01990, partial [Actinomycetota bacterium]|nr:hypothetical protein [Actinomycetota bacterium]